MILGNETKSAMLTMMCALAFLSLCTIKAIADDGNNTISREEEEMLPGRFTGRAETILNYASEEAIRLNHEEVGTEHLLLGLIREGQGIAAKALQELGIDLANLESELVKIMPPAESKSSRTPVFSESAGQVLQHAAEEAKKEDYDHVGTEHILMGLILEKDAVASKVLFSMGVTEERVRNVLRPISSTTKPKETIRLDDVQDGVRNASGVIQEALDKAAKTGGEVFLPSGRYRLDGRLVIPPGVTLMGTWTAPHHARLNTGTILMVYAGRGKEDDPPLITLSPSSTIMGMTIFYPEQTIEDVQPYPWTIQGSGMHNNVVDVTLVNPYKAIDIGTYSNELHYLRNIFGCPLKTGIYINACTDIGRIENVHFNPHYWARDEGDGEPRPDMGKLIDYLLKEGEAFVFGRTDWEYVLNTFCFGYKIGYHFIGTKQGGCNGNFLGIGADGTKNAVVVDKAAPYGLLITNGEFVSMRAEDPVEIVVGSESTGIVQFNNCAFWGPANQIARIAGKGSVSFVQCNFVYWDNAREDLPAIEANGGSLTVQNCYFHRDGKHINLGKDHVSAVIFGNTAKGGLEVENQSDGDVQIGFNVAN